MPVNDTRLIVCKQCGEAADYARGREYCAVCAADRKRACGRATMARKRIAKGVDPVKGLPALCSDCGIGYTRYVKHSTRCGECQKEKVLASARAHSALKKTDHEKRERYNRWVRNKRRTDPAWRVTAHMRTLIHRGLGKGKAGRSWREFVDYSLEELMEHLERQFLPGMSWENQGRWHIDHIVPRATFEYSSAADEEFKRCWALSNLRPMWARDNVRKNAKRTHLI